MEAHKHFLFDFLNVLKINKWKNESENLYSLCAECCKPASPKVTQLAR